MHRRSVLLAALATVPLAALAHMRLRLPRPGKGFKVGAGESRTGEHYTMRGVTLNTLDVKISGADTDGDLAVLEQTSTTPKGGPPLHLHPAQDELFYVVAGDYRFRVGDELFQLGAGDTIFLPRNVPHAFVQLSERGRMVVTYQPAGQMEAFFRRTAHLTAPLAPAEMAQLFADHGMRVVGPPLKAE